MKRYYFYGRAESFNWYCFTTETLRDAINKNRDENGKWTTSFPIVFVFIGKCVEAKDQEEAERHYRNKTNLIDCKEPACMLQARRDFFEQMSLMI